FPVRKRMAELYRALDRFKQPRNVGAVRAWFMAQLNGALGTRRLPVLPLTAARCKSRVEARLYRRVYVVYRDRSERALVKLTELALAPDPRDPSKKTFDLKWLRARIHAIAEHHGYDSKALKNALQLNLDAALDTCVSAGRSFTRTDWEHICWKPAVLMCFNPSVSSRFQSTVGPPDCLVKVHKVEILPAARYPLAELPYTRAITYVWNPEHFAQLVTRILRKDDSQPKRRRRVLHQSLHEQALPHVNAEPSPWPGFVWDRELQTKMQSPAFKQQLESELVPYLLPPKPPRMTQAEQAEWKKQEDDWQRRFEDFRVRHRLPKSLFIFTAGADLPPKRPNMSLMRVLFERKEKAFSTHVLLKQTESVVDPQLRNCLKCFAASLGALHDPRLQEKLWKQFCACFCVVTKDSLEKFLQSHPSVTPEQWIAFFESQAGPRVTFVTQLVGTSLEEYFDLSKDACGAFARGENKGYWVCKKGDRIEARPIRYFETPDQVKQRLLKHGWELLDPKPWRTGDLLRLPVAAGTGTRYLPAGYYLLGSFSNDTGINLKPCFGGEVPQNISFKALWYQGLRRCLGVL
ncbi:MAG: hypothetical protein NZ739_03905, partial [Verrucomicrobiae bacterium]|nr:hypothetical protein [Verrucomicrobiae bacterium]MDW7980824.1 hypothetical protein [Verrucomicrobiales bacterium]